MTNDEGSGGPTMDSHADDGPGWGLPAPQLDSTSPPVAAGDDSAPLTPIQQAVVSEVAEGQRALGNEMRWKRRSRLDLLGGFGGGIVGLGVDSVLASKAASQ